MNVRQSFIVYELVNELREVIYVGATTNVHQRLLDHRRKSWWSEVEFARVRVCKNRREMVDLEAGMIAHLRPKFNTYGNPTARRQPARSAA